MSYKLSSIPCQMFYLKLSAERLRIYKANAGLYQERIREFKKVSQILQIISSTAVSRVVPLGLLSLTAHLVAQTGFETLVAFSWKYHERILCPDKFPQMCIKLADDLKLRPRE